MSFSFDVKEDILKINMEASSHLIELEAWLRLVGEIYLSPIYILFGIILLSLSSFIQI